MTTRLASLLALALLAGPGCRLVVGDGDTDGGGSDGGVQRVLFEAHQAANVPPNYGCGGGPTADLLGNGREALIYKCSDPGLVDWLMAVSVDANYAFTFTRFTPVAIDWSGAPATGDFDEDGHDDVIVQDGLTGLVLSTYKDGKFNDSIALEGQGKTAGGTVVVADFDGDGHRDVALRRFLSFMDMRFDLVLLRGDGKGGFTVAATQEGGIDFLLGGADVNGDGHTDLLAQQLDVYLLDGTLTLPAPLRNGVDGSPAQSFVDVDRDGHVDAITVAQDQSALRLHRGDGKGHFGAAESIWAIPADHLYFLVRPADFDGDGKVDLLATANTSQDILLLFGRGDGTFEAPLPVAKGTHAAIADLDGDHRPDIVVQGQSNLGARTTFTALLNRVP